MSVHPARTEGELVDDLTTFLRRYYGDDVVALAQKYPREERSLYVDWSDLHQFDPGIAEDYLDARDKFNGHLLEALQQYDLPIDAGFEDAHVRVTNLDDSQTYRVGELRSEHGGQYLGISGQLAKVSGAEPRLEEIVFECQRCGTTTAIPQSRSSYDEPYECRGCERQGPFEPLPEDSAIVDQMVAKLKAPPGEGSGGQAQSIRVYLEDDLIEQGGENGLIDRAGERVTIYGTLRFDDSELDGRNARPVVDTYLDAEAIDFEQGRTSDVDVDEHRAQIKELAGREDPHRLLAESIAPEIYADEQMESIFEAAVLYLFGGMRKDPAEGSTYRGDIHLMLIGDPATAKSSVMNRLQAISPRVERASGTDLTGAGLTAAAVKDDFGGEQWSLDPGILPRANGGHVIIDEIDKADGDAPNRMHDALGKHQRVDVSKAGMQASLETQCGLIASGNPEDGRFDQYEPLAGQIDIDPALFSRFDLIYTLVDEADEEADRAKAEHLLKSIQEAGDVVRGDLDDPEIIDPPVDPETFRAWVAYAREECHPRLTDEAAELLGEFYVDTRQLNADDDDAPTAITMRKLEAGVRLAEASARVRLSAEVSPEDAERAIDLTKQAMADIDFDPSTGRFDASRSDSSLSKSQRDRLHTITDIVDEVAAEKGAPAPRDEIIDVADAQGIDERRAEHAIEKLMEKGDLYEPETDAYRTT